MSAWLLSVDIVAFTVENPTLKNNETFGCLFFLGVFFLRGGFFFAAEVP